MADNGAEFRVLTGLLLRMRMGSSKSTVKKKRYDPTKEKCYDPKDPNLKFVDGEDELDFLCEGFTSLRAQMSCGHAVTPTSLTNWCLRSLEEGECKFVCGMCNANWSYKEIRKMALLTPEEMKHFRRTMALNAGEIRKCPECISDVERENKFSLCVRCKKCSAKKGRAYEFCWQCLRDWKGPKSRLDRCENDGCCNTALKALRCCPNIVFESVQGVSGCPSVRACPTCGSLLEHKKTMCKHIVCPRCRVNFCFICLKTSIECRATSRIYAPCSEGVAPRQTVIPVWKRK